MIDFEFRKWKLIIRFPSEIEVLLIDPVFSNWIKLNKKVSIINFSTNPKSFKGINFYLRILQVVFFSVSFPLLFSNCQLAMFKFYSFRMVNLNQHCTCILF